MLFQYLCKRIKTLALFWKTNYRYPHITVPPNDRIIVTPALLFFDFLHDVIRVENHHEGNQRRNIEIVHCIAQIISKTVLSSSFATQDNGTVCNSLL